MYISIQTEALRFSSINEDELLQILGVVVQLSVSGERASHR